MFPRMAAHHFTVTHIQGTGAWANYEALRVILVLVSPARFSPGVPHISPNSFSETGYFIGVAGDSVVKNGNYD